MYRDDWDGKLLLKGISLTSSLQDHVVSKPFRIMDLIPKVEELTEKYPYPAAKAVALARGR